MAAGYTCDMGCANRAVFLMTIIDSGDVMATCQEHTGEAIANFASAMNVMIPHPGMVTVADLNEIFDRQVADVESMKASNPVKIGRTEQISLVLDAVASVIGSGSLAEVAASGNEDMPTSSDDPGTAPSELESQAIPVAGDSDAYMALDGLATR